MSNAPSVETQLRTLRSEHNLLKNEHRLLKEKFHIVADAGSRITIERDEWKRRFDKLLERTPKEK